jgi:2-polyprenyl-3-methyl-5-hydroxy-6-metoxy-1,4-benzoquinol methylase
MTLRPGPLVANLVGFDRMRRLFESWLVTVAQDRDSSRALRRLFEVADAVDTQLDRTAIRHDEGVHPKHRLTRYHDFFVDRIHEGERVLDIGTGNGALAHDIAERTGAHVTGIDVHRPYLDVARARFAHPRIDFVEADARTWSPGERYDVVVLSNVIEHIEHRVELLNAIVERTQPRRMLIRVPMLERHWWVPLRQELGLTYFSDATHYIEYDVAQLEAELAEAGFAVSELEIVWGELWAEARPSAETLSGGQPAPAVDR